MADKSKCIPVIPGSSCHECGWSFEKPYIDGGTVVEPHPVMPHGKPNMEVTARCVNCGVAYNLDTVKCSHCDFEPVSAEMWDALRAEKNKFRRTQLLAPLAVRPEPITTTADANG